MPKAGKMRREDLTRLMIFILGYRPDEFGVVPGPGGYVPYKELLQVIHEEPGWGHVRQSHFNEILMGNGRSLFEWDDKRIRALKRDWSFDLGNLPDTLPKILFIAVRRRAHPHIMERGLKSNPEKYLSLSKDKEMAMRIGHRRDPKPLLLEVLAQQAEKSGVQFYPFGDLLLAKEIPVRFLSGPPVSRDETPVPGQGANRREQNPPDFTPGSFFLDLDRQASPRPQTKGKKRKGWKETARKLRKKRGHQ
jgi:putative RNA 2'-phosphotransferase